MKRLILICTLFTAVACLYAQRVQVAAPSHVMVGEEFQIEYTINTRDVRNFHIGSLPSGLECRYGPFRSEQSSFQVVNGHTTSSSSVSVAYVLIARNPASTLPLEGQQPGFHTDQDCRLGWPRVVAGLWGSRPGRRLRGGGRKAAGKQRQRTVYQGLCQQDARPRARGRTPYL